MSRKVYEVIEKTPDHESDSITTKTHDMSYRYVALKFLETHHQMKKKVNSLGVLLCALLISFSSCSGIERDKSAEEIIFDIISINETAYTRVAENYSGQGQEIGLIVVSYIDTLLIEIRSFMNKKEHCGYDIECAHFLMLEHGIWGLEFDKKLRMLEGTQDYSILRSKYNPENKPWNEVMIIERTALELLVQLQSLRNDLMLIVANENHTSRSSQ